MRDNGSGYLFEDHVVDSFFVEARAYEKAIFFARDLGFKQVIFEGDSLTIINRVNSCDKDTSVLRPIIEDIKVWLGRFQNVTLVYVPRTTNEAAHVTVKEGCNLQISRFWIEKALKMVESVAAEDWAKFSSFC